ncbi:hypothetical protein GCWU000341_00598 [Oribacterium sp. oral taxon 078 str. F0262]|nr:hypothetical protein GCWU000341_00598 [Oribacterium sp. oral taxon 078 str. F0262]
MAEKLGGREHPESSLSALEVDFPSAGKFVGQEQLESPFAEPEVSSLRRRSLADGSIPSPPYLHWKLIFHQRGSSADESVPSTPFAEGGSPGPPPVIFRTADSAANGL